MKKNYKKRILSWMISIAVAVSFMPVMAMTVWAAETGGIENIQIVYQGETLQVDTSKLGEPVTNDYTYVRGKNGEFFKGKDAQVSGYEVEKILSSSGISPDNLKSSNVKIEFSAGDFVRSFDVDDLLATRYCVGYDQETDEFDSDTKTEVPAIITNSGNRQLVFGQTLEDVSNMTVTKGKWVSGLTKITITEPESDYAAGTGTAANPYQIATAEQLEKFAQGVNSDAYEANVCFKLKNDITLTEKWIPAGAPETDQGGTVHEHLFKGIFDGNGKTISGLNVSTDAGYAGLFGDVSGTIKNLSVKGSVSSTTDGDYVAGIVAKLETGGAISDCTSYVSVGGESAYNVGGIAGFVGTDESDTSKDTTVSNCINNGEVTGSQHVGGIVGYNNGKISNCVNKAKVISTYSRKGGTGGIAGLSGDKGDKNTGVCNSTATIINCYNVGEINAKANGSWFGGIAGFINNQSSITNCYSTGAITNVYDYAGAIAGNDESINKITNSFSLSEIAISDKNPGNAGTVKSAVELKSAETVTALGDAFKVNNGISSGGFPLLTFETEEQCTHPAWNWVQDSAAGYLVNGKKHEVCTVCGLERNQGTVIPGYSKSYVSKFKLSKGKKSFTAKWKKQSKKNRKQFNGYQIRYSMNSNMAGAGWKNLKNSSRSKKVKKLAKKQLIMFSLEAIRWLAE